jgi:hypothetical protein
VHDVHRMRDEWAMPGPSRGAAPGRPARPQPEEVR